ncbi:MAG: nucleotidyl transferase AbiEii/AbiGii toxin family protein [Bacteroidetes bacterium]|nr:nucleotidyl transferase AbiEii/AbiGii toxin family protein [Bacteroidota bacterium]MBU1719336.1 nucleotidyl transferase AbiEii/AbiGii toxin family protein [Bacteroidota bacterium]
MNTKLKTESVIPQVLFTLERLMELPLFNNFRLAGGTAFALQKGHRISNDLDLFTNQEFNSREIEFVLKKEWANQVEVSVRIFGVTAWIHYNVQGDSIKVDIIREEEPFLKPAHEIGGVRISAFEDIAAMKMKAITSRRARKDYIDIFFLLETYALSEMLDLFEKRFVYYDRKDPLMGLADIDAADSDMMPKMITPVDWPDIKRKIKSQLKEYLKSELSS